MSLIAQKYFIRLTIPLSKNNDSIEIPIMSKNHFYNESFKIPLHQLPPSKSDRDDLRVILIEIVKKGHEKR